MTAGRSTIELPGNVERFYNSLGGDSIFPFTWFRSLCAGSSFDYNGDETSSDEGEQK